MNATTVARPDLFAMRERELGRVAGAGAVYLDYTGAALYPESLLRSHFRALGSRVLGNPHSTSPASTSATDDIDEAKRAVLRFFQGDPAEYEVIFTTNATAAIRLVGEAFEGIRLLLSADNHNSVLGLREAVRRRGGRIEYLPLNDELRITSFAPESVNTPALFAYPAQSNFSGVRHPLEWIAIAQKAGYHVLLDAASYVPTAPLSLAECKPDFVAISFYKMFGYPSGIGALIAQRSALKALQRPAFAGGTVEFASVLADAHLLKAAGAGWEDGTVNFLAAGAVTNGLGFLEALGRNRIAAEVERLTTSCLRELQVLRYANGQPLIRIYGPHDNRGRGGTIAFNLQRADGAYIPYETVIDRAAEQGISLRGGCFCNPGAAEYAFGYTAVELCAALAETRDHFTHERLRSRLGNKPVGAVRASFGYGSSVDDVAALIEFTSDFLQEE